MYHNITTHDDRNKIKTTEANNKENVETTTGKVLVEARQTNNKTTIRTFVVPSTASSVPSEDPSWLSATELLLFLYSGRHVVLAYSQTMNLATKVMTITSVPGRRHAAAHRHDRVHHKREYHLFSISAAIHPQWRVVEQPAHFTTHSFTTSITF